MSPDSVASENPDEFLFLYYNRSLFVLQEKSETGICRSSCCQAQEPDLSLLINKPCTVIQSFRLLYVNGAHHIKTQ